MILHNPEQMKTILKKFIFALGIPAALAGCRIEDPDFFVPEVAFTGSDEKAVFEPAGGSESFAIEANCDWTLSCPADWVVLSAASGNRNGTVTVTVEPTKLPRNTTLTLYADEVETRTSVIAIVQQGVVEISAVTAPLASDTASSLGTTAVLTASYTGLSLSENDRITAGFVLTPLPEGADLEISAAVDREAGIFRAALTDLVPNRAYRCTAWARLNDGAKVTGDAIVFTPVLLPTELKSVGETTVSRLKTATGTTATLESSYLAVSLGSGDVVTAGFTLTPDDGLPFEIEAEVDPAAGTFRADAAGLIPGTTYSCTAWARLNGGAPVTGASTTFRPSATQPTTLVADFSSNALWGLPESNSAMEQKEIAVTDPDGYTWKISGGCISGGCLWLACESKSEFNGYVILPRLDDRTVRSIGFPNDGPSASGKARITISVSEDGGNTFTPIPGCEGTECGTFRLTGQKPGSLYKIENVAVGGSSGYSKTVRLTIEAE